MIGVRAAVAAALALALAATGVGAASATTARAPRSTVERVSPMRVTVGRTITIRGVGFNSSRVRNTIVFKGAAGKLILAKPRRASETKLVVTVPPLAERILNGTPPDGVPTRVTIRVVTSRYGRASIKRHSPILVSAP